MWLGPHLPGDDVLGRRGLLLTLTLSRERDAGPLVARRDCLRSLDGEGQPQADALTLL